MFGSAHLFIGKRNGAQTYKCSMSIAAYLAEMSLVNFQVIQ